MKKPFQFKKIKDPGFGSFDSKKIARILNKDGSFNVKHINRKTSFRDLYHHLININWVTFFCYIFIGYLIINLLFALIYHSIGIESIGIESKTELHNYIQCFYFSTQTFTTVGYGTLSPKGDITSLVASIEAFIGLLAFAFATGLFYGRFSKPKPSILFSDKIILRPHEDGRALMFRITNEHTNALIDVKTHIIMIIRNKNEDGSYGVTPYQMKLERDNINFLSLTWTIVMKIDKDNPLFEKTDEEIKALDGEILVRMNYFDDTFSQELYQQTSYILKDVVLNEKFVKSYGANREGQNVLDYSKLNLTEKIDA
ncbi:hypothetical protein UJ101_00721 [Flavobacteriaceae bacterium UJ101]|nr:hypothetical protein UJ101_00721 [Flavobacteriaceae bacterium UJ101]